MKKVFVILKWLIAILLLVFVLAFTEATQKIQLVKLNKITIERSGDNFVNEHIILEYLNENDISFDSVLLIDFKKERLEFMLKKHPAIKDVEVFVNQKGFLDIQIVQKQAIVRIKTKNDDYYLDEFGEKMDISKHYTSRLIVVTGNVSTDNHNDIVDFVNLVSASNFWSSQLTQIHIQDNNIILIPRVGDHKIHLGSFIDSKRKLENLYLFYNNALRVKGWQTYSDISLKFNNQIVCTKK